MDRITDKHLQSVVDRINDITGHSRIVWTPRPDGKGSQAAIGSYCLDYAYGGVALEQIMNDGGGVIQVIGRGTKRETYNRLHAFVSGLSAK